MLSCLLNVCYYYSLFFYSCQVVLKERIELSIQSYQDCVIPVNYKSIGTPSRTRTDTILLLRETPHTNWAIGAFVWSRHQESNLDLLFRREPFYPLNYSELNIFVKTYNSQTPSGLNFHLSLSDTGVCCIIVHDVFDCEVTLRYFTNVNKALRFINNL